MRIEVKKEHLELVKSLKIVNKKNEAINEDIPLNFSHSSSSFFKLSGPIDSTVGNVALYEDELFGILNKSNDKTIRAKLGLSDNSSYPLVLMKDMNFVVEILLQNLSLQEGVYELKDDYWVLVD